MSEACEYCQEWREDLGEMIRDRDKWRARAEAAEELASDQAREIISICRKLDRYRGALRGFVSYAPPTIAEMILRDSEIDPTELGE